MKRLATYFFRGLVVTGPVAITLYICWAIFSTIDRWLGLPIPGAGFLLTLVLVVLVGFLASNLLTRSLVAALEQVLVRLPFVRLLYSSTKDLFNAFVGEQRRFDKPVLVRVSTTSEMRVLGFVTESSMARFGLPEWVAVYVPQSYGFAGNVVVVPREHVAPVGADSAEVMAFIISGGVAGGRPSGAVSQVRGGGR